jgi:predicted PurR-regulated permease PerM
MREEMGMNNMTEQGNGQLYQKNMMAFVIQLAALAALIAYCIIIVGPFAGLVIWGVVTAVAVYPVHLKLASVMGGREKLSATLIVILGLAIVLFPGWIMVKSALLSIMTFASNVEAGTVHIPPPNESVADWPLIGERLYADWSKAAMNVEETLAEFQPQLRELAETMVRRVGSAVVGMLQIAASTIIAGVTLMYTQSGYNLTQSIADKVVPGRGKSLTDLSVATIRSVTNGVLGVAFIQAVLLGVGFAVMDVPHAGLLAVIVLITAIIQIPALLIALPVIIWVFSVAAPVPATIFAVYSLVAAASDNVLKPVLLGRGVNLPALIVLIGAIGGMIAFGIIGLFLGAVILGLAYSIGTAWLKGENASPAEPAEEG